MDVRGPINHLMNIREEFETACKQHAVDAGFPEYDYGFERSSEDGNCYSDSHTQAAWWAWQTSRASLVIKIPKITLRFGCDAQAYMRDQCRQAIEAAGVQVKS